MKEIKFRAWDKKALCFNNGVDLVIDAWGYISEIDFIPPCEYYKEDRTGDYEISFYTGLKDKNGVEIYEKDFIKKDGEFSLRISFRNGSFTAENAVLFVYLHALDMSEYEIIGNVYEGKINEKYKS